MSDRQNSANEQRQKRIQSLAKRARDQALEIQKHQGDREASFAEIALNFLKAEADPGLTLARLAANSADAKKKTRNRLHARQAYDKLVEYRGTAAAAAGEELEELDGRIAELRAQLLSLGETL